MSTTYTVVFANAHGSHGEYVFCMEKPIINNDLTAGNVIANASIAQDISDGHDFTLTTQIQTNAWCGKFSHEPAEGVLPIQSHTEAVELGNNKNGGDTLSMVVVDESVTFDKVKTKDAPTGCFTISQPTSFNASDHIAIGLAQKDKEAPSSMPVVIFYVLKVMQRTVKNVNYQSFSTKPGVVDFTNGDGQGHYAARVVHEKNGDFTVTYQ
ncbi:hypothetical protein CEP51_002122 [Fusarium floridanum]|uniref:Uncharacterized protein n=1 Tax=Fusarium floridanum TaxID=1325733 RepID=A0A428SCV9_9HYPO|nr:hypothetical protein CEP51_002122 [Fusarium floridanum]